MGTNGPFTVDSLISRECHLRRAAREFVDLVFSVVHPDGDDAAISFLVFEIYDVPQMPGAPQTGRAHQRRAWHRFAETVLPLQQARFQGLDRAFSAPFGPDPFFDPKYGYRAQLGCIPIQCRIADFDPTVCSDRESVCARKSRAPDRV